MALESKFWVRIDGRAHVPSVRCLLLVVAGAGWALISNRAVRRSTREEGGQDSRKAEAEAA